MPAWEHSALGGLPLIGEEGVTMAMIVAGMTAAEKVIADVTIAVVTIAVVTIAVVTIAVVTTIDAVMEGGVAAGTFILAGM